MGRSTLEAWAPCVGQGKDGRSGWSSLPLAVGWWRGGAQRDRRGVSRSLGGWMGSQSIYDFMNSDQDAKTCQKTQVISTNPKIQSAVRLFLSG